MPENIGRKFYVHYLLSFPPPNVYFVSPRVAGLGLGSQHDQSADIKSSQLRLPGNQSCQHMYKKQIVGSIHHKKMMAPILGVVENVPACVQHMSPVGITTNKEMDTQNLANSVRANNQNTYICFMTKTL